MLGRHYSLDGPWWWSSGQRARPLLRRTEFESCWGLLFLLLSTEKNENKHKKVGIGPLFSKNKYSFGVRRLLFLEFSSRSDLSLFVAAKPFKMMIIIITSRERHSQLQEKNSEVVITVKCFTAAAARSTTTLSLCRQFVKNRFFYSDSLRP